MLEKSHLFTHAAASTILGIAKRIEGQLDCSSQSVNRYRLLRHVREFFLESSKPQLPQVRYALISSW
jgi:hypothetical protein